MSFMLKHIPIDPTLIVTLCSTFAIALLLRQGRSCEAPRLVRLPGPRGHPLFGNILQLQTDIARMLGQWTQRYGGIFGIKLGNRETLILNTYEAVVKTIVQQGTAFQSRPKFNLWHGAFSKALDHDAPSTIGTMEYSENVSRYRKFLAPQISSAKLPSYSHIFMRRYLRLVRLLAEASASGLSQDFGYHWWTTAIGISADQLVGRSLDEEMTKVIADTNIKILRQRNLATPLHDYIPILASAEKVILAVLAPLLPFLRRGPSFISSWLTSLNDAEIHAKELRHIEVNYCTLLLQELHHRINNGDTVPSVLGDLIRGVPETLSAKEELLFATTLAGAGMGAGTTLTWLTGKLAACPEMQEKAFAAICAVYEGQAPDPLDTDRVEYIKALGLEAGRFWTSIRLGFPRETHQDAVVDGVLIPKGTLIIYNSFQINRDPARYDLPEEFVPERWIDGRDGQMSTAGPQITKIGVPHLTHGAGRRVCMGIPNVNKMLYGSLALLLYFFKLERSPLDDTAKAEVFPSFRATQEATAEMHPIDDQISRCEAQALPGYVGIKLTPRNPEALTRWLTDSEEQSRG